MRLHAAEVSLSKKLNLGSQLQDAALKLTLTSNLPAEDERQESPSLRGSRQQHQSHFLTDTLYDVIQTVPTRLLLQAG